jgi:hypothetical protein
MTTTRRAILSLLRPVPAVLAGAFLLLSGPVAKAQWPGILEAKNIAEEAFI